MVNTTNQFELFLQVAKVIGVVVGAFIAYGKFMSHIREMELKIQMLEGKLAEKEKEFEKLDAKIDLLNEKFSGKLDTLLEKIINVQIQLGKL